MTKSRTIYLDNPTDEWKSKIDEFFKGIDSPVTFAMSPDGADVVVNWPGEREHSEVEKLKSGGRMTCPNSFRCAARLRIDRKDFGKLLNLLDIKICACQLGAFK